MDFFFFLFDVTIIAHGGVGPGFRGGGRQWRVSRDAADAVGDPLSGAR